MRGYFVSLPVHEWLELHKDELLENWQLVEQKKPLKKIAPLE